MSCGCTADGQRRAEAARAYLHHRHARLQRAALGRKGQHRLGQTVLGGTGRTAEIQIGEDACLQTMAAGVAVQPNDRRTVDLLIIAAQDGHRQTPHFQKTTTFLL